MFVIKHKNIFFGLSGLLVIASIALVAVVGLETGIDFTGGSILEVSYTKLPVETTTERPQAEQVQALLESLSLGGSSLRSTGETGYVIRTPFLEDSQRAALVEGLSFGGTREVTVERFSSVGPTIGEELRSKAWVAIVVVVLAIILFIAYAFRSVSKPVSSWRYGITAIIALVHDIIIPTGVFAILGYFTGAQIDVLFVMALLAILGFSVNDTIVVFDRVRENLRINQELGKNEEFDEVVGRSLSQTYARSLNTSLTTLVVLVALYLVGGATIQNFVLTLIAGVIVGTYSSIFLACPVLVMFAKRKSA